MIRLVLQTGGDVYVNPPCIVSIQPEAGGTFVKTAAGAYSVRQSITQILTLMEGK